MGRISGAIDTSALFTPAFPDIQTALTTRASAAEMPAMSVQDVDDFLTAQIGPNWELNASLTAEEIAGIYTNGAYGILLEVLCEASEGSASMMQGPFEENFVEVIAGEEIQLEENFVLNGGGNSALSADGGEGGTVNIRDAGDVHEGSAALFKIEIDAKYFNGIRFDYQTVSGSATGGTNGFNGDFIAKSGTMTIADGAEAGSMLEVATFNDYIVEEDETFQMQISNLENLDGAEGDCTLGDSSGSATIKNTTTLPKAAIGSGSEVVEGGHFLISVSLDHPYGQPVTVNWSVEDVTTEGGQDLTPLSGSLTFNPITSSQPGETQKTIDITAKVDTILEPTETFIVKITAGAHVAINVAESTNRIADGINMAAYRPQTEGPLYGAPFQRREIPGEKEEDPGVYIRRNGDDDNGNGTPDRDDTLVVGENDLIEVQIAGLVPGGAQYKLRRSGQAIQAWSDYTKQVPYFVNGNERLMGGTGAIWVEWVTDGTGSETAVLETVLVKDDVELGVTDRLVFHPFRGIAIVLGGEFQAPSDPIDPDRGTFQIAIDLYEEGY